MADHNNISNNPLTRVVFIQRILKYALMPESALKYHLKNNINEAERPKKIKSKHKSEEQKRVNRILHASAKNGSTARLLPLFASVTSSWREVVTCYLHPSYCKYLFPRSHFCFIDFFVGLCRAKYVFAESFPSFPMSTTSENDNNNDNNQVIAVNTPFSENYEVFSFLINLAFDEWIQNKKQKGYRLNKELTKTNDSLLRMAIRNNDDHFLKFLFDVAKIDIVGEYPREIKYEAEWADRNQQRIADRLKQQEQKFDEENLVSASSSVFVRSLPPITEQDLAFALPSESYYSVRHITSYLSLAVSYSDLPLLRRLSHEYERRYINLIQRSTFSNNGNRMRQAKNPRFTLYNSRFQMGCRAGWKEPPLILFAVARDRHDVLDFLLKEKGLMPDYFAYYQFETARKLGSPLYVAMKYLSIRCFRLLVTYSMGLNLEPAPATFDGISRVPIRRYQLQQQQQQDEADGTGKAKKRYNLRCNDDHDYSLNFLPVPMPGGSTVIVPNHSREFVRSSFLPHEKILREDHWQNDLGATSASLAKMAEQQQPEAIPPKVAARGRGAHETAKPLIRQENIHRRFAIDLLTDVTFFNDILRARSRSLDDLPNTAKNFYAKMEMRSEQVQQYFCEMIRILLEENPDDEDVKRNFAELERKYVSDPDVRVPKRGGLLMIDKQIRGMNIVDEFVMKLLNTKHQSHQDL